MEGCTPISYPIAVFLPCPSSGEQSCSCHPVCCLLASMGWHPSLHQMHVFLLAILSIKIVHTHYTLPGIFIYLHWMHSSWHLHGRSHSFPFIHPREVFLAWHWVIARLSSSCGIVLLSHPPGSRLNCGGAGTSAPYLADAYAQGNTCFWHYEEEPAMQCRSTWIPMLVFHFIWGDVCHMIWCTILWGLSSHLSLIFLFPWKASALTRMRSPGFKPTVHLFSSHSTIFVSEPLP